MRLLPLVIIMSVAALSLALSTMSGSEMASPKLVTGAQPGDQTATSARTTSALELAVPAPHAGSEGRSVAAATNDAFEIEFVTVADPGSDGLVIAQPQAVAPTGNGQPPLDLTRRKESSRGGAPIEATTQRLRHRDATLRAAAAPTAVTPEHTATASARAATGALVTLLTPTASATASAPASASTATPTATATSAPAASTSTAVPPTATAAVPAATATPSVTPTPTPVTSTPTAAPATLTPTPTPAASTATATATPGISAAAATATARAALPVNETVVSINTPTNTPTPTRTPTPTSVPPTSTPTKTAAPTSTPASSGAINSVDRLIATRPDHAVPHEITLPDPISWWSWGQHGTEDTKFKHPDSGTVAPWLVMFRDASVINTATNARFNVRRIALWNYQPSNQTWVKLFDGLPQWRVSSNPDTTSGYTDITPTVEADGSYSFAISAGRVLHMAAGPWPSIPEGSGIVAIIEARLLGSAADIAAAKAGAAAGADYRAPGGGFSQGMDTPGYYASGFGQFGLLTGNWKAFDMISSTLTDDQVRANPPALQ